MTQKQEFSSPHVQVSWGELIDKVTILEIKQRHIKTPAALANVENELAALNGFVTHALATYPDTRRLKERLTDINQKLWDIEDAIRMKESVQSFDDEFIDLARGVYFTNDERAAVKRQINELLSSALVEEKSYQPY